MLRFILMFILACHGIFSLYITFKYGYLSVFPPFNEPHTYQIFFDLVAALFLITAFISFELKRKKRSLKPMWFVIIGIIFTGSIAPMIFILFNKELFNSNN